MPCAQTYQYGIYNESGQIGALTVEHSDFWGFGNAIDTEGSTQANPQVFKYNWLHDAVENDNGFGNLRLPRRRDRHARQRHRGLRRG